MTEQQPAVDLGPEGGIAIAVHGLDFVYPDGTRALTGVDLAIGPGERVAIIGQNGSGKSTLVRHFNGLLRATEGEVVIGGEAVGDQHVADLARRVGIVFQNPDRQIFSGRAQSEVAFGARNAGLRGDELTKRVATALRLVGLADEAHANPYDLGYSRRKLLATASVLAMATPAIVLDEPTTGQDGRGVGRVRALVERLGELGRTVIAISHDMRFVAEAFPRIVVMRAGTVILDGTPGDVFAQDRWGDLASTYLEPPLPARLGARLGLGSTPTDAALIQQLGEKGT